MLVLAINSNRYKTRLLHEHNEPTSNATINQSTINPDLLLFPGELRFSCEKINLDVLTRISRDIPRQDITFLHSSSNMDIYFSTTPKYFVFTPNMLTAGIVHHNPIIPISITSEMDIIIFVLIIINVSMFVLFWLINARKQYLRKLHLERIDNGYFSILLRETELKIPCLKLFSIHKDLNKYSATGSSSSSQDLLDTKFKDQFLQNINSLLDRNMDDHQFGITQLCKDMGMSRAQIYRKFKGYDHRTLHNYLRSYRLNKARELLLTTNLNVSEVTYETGFISVSHFSRVFTDEFGKHPKEYRKKSILFT